MLFFIVLDIKKQLEKGVNNIVKDLEAKNPESKNNKVHKAYMKGVKDTLSNLDALLKTIGLEYDQPGVSNSVIVHMDNFDGIEEYDTLGFLETFEDIEELLCETKNILSNYKNEEDYEGIEDINEGWDEFGYGENGEVD